MKIDKIPKIIVICGPTGIGKTRLTIDIFKKFPSIIISADSVQVYKYMNIGTAKISPEENKEAFHHLTDTCYPDENFDAAKFAELAQNLINTAFKKGKYSIISGGTGLYIKALTEGIFRSRPADNEVIESLYKAEESDKGFLHRKLSEADPESAAKIHKNDQFRLARALEYFHSTGEKISEKQKKEKPAKKQFEVLKLGLFDNRKDLYERIDKRADIMIEQGLLEEVKNLRNMGYPPTLKSMGAIGYKHMNLYIDKKVSWDEAVRLMKRDSRRYAKRQLTWFRADRRINWISPDDTEKAEYLIREFINS